MHALGIDPDVKDLAIAGWDEDGPTAAMVVHAIGKGQGEQSQVRMARLLDGTTPGMQFDFDVINIIAIEGQQIDRRGVPPRDLFTLAHVTGAAMNWCVKWFKTARIIVPTPKEWKGGVAKHAHQARLYRDLGWGYTIIGSGKGRYARPTNPPSRFNHISPGQWKHVGDAILLAKWAHEQNT